MEQLSHSEMTQRLGQEPEKWTFLGQCYDAGDGNKRVCVLTLKETQVCFTLKLKSGAKGRMTISPEAIAYFERWNPDLYVKLKAGLMFLELRQPAIAADFAAAAVRKRIAESQAKYDIVRREAKSRIQKYRQDHRRAKLPEYLEAMRFLLQQTGHYFAKDESRALSLEQKTVEIEKALIVARAQDVPEVPKPEATPVETLTKIPAGMNLPDIPELPF
jgi:hypothetical protein